MGGSSSSSPWNPDRLRERANQAKQDSERELAKADYEADVAEILANLLFSVNDRDTHRINRLLDTISDAIEDEIEGSVRLMFGGSVAKHTYVDGISDVDSLVFLDPEQYKDRDPKSVLRQFAEAIAGNLEGCTVSTGNLAVTVKFKDCELQLLPAMKATGDDIKVPSWNGENWRQINPKAFSEKLTLVNKNLGNRLIPTIKLIKQINDSLPDKSRLSGYHIEALSLQVFEGYEGRRTPKDMLGHFFKHAPSLVLSSIRDVTGQSPAIDDYLGKENSPYRTRVSRDLEAVSNRIDSANQRLSAESWREILSID